MNQPKTEKSSESAKREIIDEITESLEKGAAVRLDFRDEDGGGRINIDRPLPFLCVYRTPKDRRDRGTANLILGEAAYLIAADEDDLPNFVRKISKILADRFGAFLIIEIWSANLEKERRTDEFTTESKTKFRIFVEESREIPSTVETLREALKSLNVPYFQTETETVAAEEISPAGMKPLLTHDEMRRLSCLLIGLEISPVYRDAQTEELYLSTLRFFRREFSKALQQTFFEFVHVQTPERPTEPQMLGRRSVVDAVWAADAELSALSDTFNYLLAVTPVNSNQAFREFEKSGFENEPVFHYRLLTIDPEELKRKLYSISFEDVEDPTLAYLLRDKRIELDRQITLIEDRNTPRFLYESLQLFPPVEDALLDLAEKILRKKAPAGEPGATLDAQSVAGLAREEIAFYRKTYPLMTATVEIREDTPAGLMVSHGNLMVGHRTGISESRIGALLQHEIGTHSVTYFNGRAQPLKLLYSGLPGYEQLQEGLAVFAEYLVGGLSFARMRTLAARVVGVRRLTEGRSFAEVFDELCGEYEFSGQSAFNIAMRIFRGGGLTKDAVYLRGLVEVLEYLQTGGDIETLFVGKMGPEHVSIIRELQWREVLRPAPLVPRYMEFPEALEKIEKVRKGLSVVDLI